MSERFERFAKMAQEEFGLTVVKSANHENSTFEDLFGVSIESLTQYELPKTPKGENSMTNREWMEQLTDHQLAEFFTHGLLVNYKGNSNELFAPFYLSIQQIRRDYMSNTLGIEKWLTENQKYDIL